MQYVFPKYEAKRLGEDLAAHLLHYKTKSRSVPRTDALCQTTCCTFCRPACLYAPITRNSAKDSEGDRDSDAPAGVHDHCGEARCTPPTRNFGISATVSYIHNYEVRLNGFRR